MERKKYSWRKKKRRNKGKEEIGRVEEEIKKKGVEGRK